MSAEDYLNEFQKAGGVPLVHQRVNMAEAARLARLAALKEAEAIAREHERSWRCTEWSNHASAALLIADAIAALAQENRK